MSGVRHSRRQRSARPARARVAPRSSAQSAVVHDGVVTESIGIVIAAAIAALTFTVGEVIRIRERRVDRIAARVAVAQESLRRFMLEAARAPKRNKPVHMETAMQASGAISGLLAVVGRRDRRFVMRLLEAVGATPTLHLDDVAVLTSIASTQLDLWLMSKRAGRAQGHPLERMQKYREERSET